MPNHKLPPTHQTRYEAYTQYPGKDWTLATRHTDRKLLLRQAEGHITAGARVKVFRAMTRRQAIRVAALAAAITSGCAALTRPSPTPHSPQVGTTTIATAGSPAASTTLLPSAAAGESRAGGGAVSGDTTTATYLVTDSAGHRWWITWIPNRYRALAAMGALYDDPDARGPGLPMTIQLADPTDRKTWEPTIPPRSGTPSWTPATHPSAQSPTGSTNAEAKPPPSPAPGPR